MYELSCRRILAAGDREDKKLGVLSLMFVHDARIEHIQGELLKNSYSLWNTACSRIYLVGYLPRPSGGRHLRLPVKPLSYSNAGERLTQ